MIQIVGPRLSQWDTGRRLSVTGSTATHAHMANKGDSYAPIIDIVNGEAKIPDYLLQTGKELCVYLVQDGITQERNSFFVQKRERPENYVYEDDRRNYIYELITNAENAVKRANEAASNAEAAKADLEKYVDDTLDSLSAVLYTKQEPTPEQQAQARANIEVPHIIIGELAPDTKTKGVPGDLYMDYKTGALYKCYDAIESEHDSEYFWNRIAEMKIGDGAPKSYYVAEAGELYMDRTNGDLYICTGEHQTLTGNYAWVKVGGGTGGGSVDLSNYYTKDEIGQLTEDIVANLHTEFVNHTYVEEQVEDALGDISTALDSISAIQNGLIGDTIIFYVDNIPLAATAGMTWQVWVDSQKNIIGACFSEEPYEYEGTTYTDFVADGAGDPIVLDGQIQGAHAKIIAGAVYNVL